MGTGKKSIESQSRVRVFAYDAPQDPPAARPKVWLDAPTPPLPPRQKQKPVEAPSPQGGLKRVSAIWVSVRDTAAALMPGTSERSTVEVGINFILREQNDPPAPEELAVNGLRGLTALVPEVHFTTSKEGVVLAVGGNSPMEFVPEGDKPEHIAKLYLNVCNYLAGVSPVFAKTSKKERLDAFFSTTLGFHHDRWTRYIPSEDSASLRTLSDGASVSEFNSSFQDGILTVHISDFRTGTAANLRRMLFDKVRAGLSGLVLDLRGNPGGIMDDAQAMADMFLKEGVIVRTQVRGRTEDVEAMSGAFFESPEKLKIVVLVDGRSASAAEIVAAALGDNGRAVIVGTSTFGKGVWQNSLEINDGALLKVTKGTWSSGRPSVHGVGFTPAVCTTSKDGSLPAEAPRWRFSNSAKERARLREACPPQDEGDSENSLNVALELLADEKRFQRALQDQQRLATPPTGSSGEIARKNP